MWSPPERLSHFLQWWTDRRTDGRCVCPNAAPVAAVFAWVFFFFFHSFCFHRGPLMSVLTRLMFYFGCVIRGNVWVHVRTDCAFFFPKNWGRGCTHTYIRTRTHLRYCGAERFPLFIPSQLRLPREQTVWGGKSLWLTQTKPASIFLYIELDDCLVKQDFKPAACNCHPRTDSLIPSPEVEEAWPHSSLDVDISDFSPVKLLHLLQKRAEGPKAEGC